MLLFSAVPSQILNRHSHILLDALHSRELSIAHFKWSIHAASLGSSRLRLIYSYHSLTMYPMLGGAHGISSTLQLHSGSFHSLSVLLFFKACCVKFSLNSWFDCICFKLCQHESIFPDLEPAPVTWKLMLTVRFMFIKQVNHLFSFEYVSVSQTFL